MDVVATSPEVDVEVVDITSLEVEAVVEEEEVEVAMEGLEVLVETLVGVEVSSARARGEGTTAATGGDMLSEGLAGECPRVTGWTGWDREEAMPLLSEVGVGGKIKVGKIYCINNVI